MGQANATCGETDIKVLKRAISKNSVKMHTSLLQDFFAFVSYLEQNTGLSACTYNWLQVVSFATLIYPFLRTLSKLRLVLGLSVYDVSPSRGVLLNVWRLHFLLMLETFNISPLSMVFLFLHGTAEFGEWMRHLMDGVCNLKGLGCVYQIWNWNFELARAEMHL